MKPVSRNRKKSVFVNIVPLVDVLIILLFFFIVTMQIPGHKDKALNVLLPNMETAGKNDIQKCLSISIDENGNLFLDHQAITQEELVEVLELGTSFNKENAVVILADERSKLQTLTFVMDTCKKNGLDKMRLLTR